MVRSHLGNDTRSPRKDENDILLTVDVEYCELTVPDTVLGPGFTAHFWSPALEKVVLGFGILGFLTPFHDSFQGRVSGPWLFWRFCTTPVELYGY